MLTKIALVLAALVSVASADVGLQVSRPTHTPIVLRASANQYSLVGEGIVTTKNCTVSANGSVWARVTRDNRGKRFLTFIDRDGNDEAQCEILRTGGR